ncbi:unnamed protein product [Symbiodinium sp. CCMP2456]|nr:unnamed protein product [Symbiodinium sp. CCMP2456]
MPMGCSGPRWISWAPLPNGYVPCVWVTHEAGEASRYSPASYVGGGYWFQFLICVPRNVVDNWDGVTRKLGGSGKQIRVQAKYLEMCGICFRARHYDEIVTDNIPTAVSEFCHGYQCWCEGEDRPTTSWHPWAEASPIDPEILKMLGFLQGADSSNYSPFGISEKGPDADESTSMDVDSKEASASSAADKEEAGPPVDPEVTEGLPWKVPGSRLMQESSTMANKYPLVRTLLASSFRAAILPTFQKQVPQFGEGHSMNLPKLVTMTSMATGLQERWSTWTRAYEKAFKTIFRPTSVMPAAYDKVPYEESQVIDPLYSRNWEAADVLSAASVHGIMKPFRTACAIAHSSAPPFEQPERWNKVASGGSKNLWWSGDLETYLTDAAKAMGLGEVNVRTINMYENDQPPNLGKMISLASGMKADPAFPNARTHILIVWKGEEFHELHQSWSYLTRCAKKEDFDKCRISTRQNLEALNRDFASVSLCGLRSIWQGVRSANFLTVPFDVLFEGLPQFKWGTLAHVRDSMTAVCCKISAAFLMAQLTRFPDIDANLSSGQVNQMTLSRTPDPRYVDRSAQSSFEQLIFGDAGSGAAASDTAAAKDQKPVRSAAKSMPPAQPKKIGLADFGLEDEDDEGQDDPAGAAPPKAAPMVPVAPKLPDSSPPTTKVKEEPADMDVDQEAAALAKEADTAAELNDLLKQARRQYAHYPTNVDANEVRRVQATEIYARIRELAASAEDDDAVNLQAQAAMLAGFIMASEGVRPANFYPPGELAYDAIAERLTTSRRREDANSTMIREMQSGAFIPCLFNRYDGQAVSALDARWAPEFGNRGEIESSLGATISGLDASIAALSGIPVIHPHIPAAYGIARSLTCFFQSLQTVTRHRGMGALPFNHIVFQDADLAPPTYEEWPDMIAQTPRAVIQSMRLALVSNGAMRAGVRDDQALPEGFRVVKAFEWMVGCRP